MACTRRQVWGGQGGRGHLLTAVRPSVLCRHAPLPPPPLTRVGLTWDTEEKWGWGGRDWGRGPALESRRAAGWG